MRKRPSATAPLQGGSGTATTTTRTSTTSSSRRALAAWAQSLSRIVIVAILCFFALASIGVAVQIYRYSRGSKTSERLAEKFQLLKEQAANPERQTLTSLTFSTTYLALTLWGKLLLSILIPTTEVSFVVAEEGWSALQPSIFRGFHWFAYETTLQFKLACASIVVLLILLWALEREIKRRGIVERIRATIDATSGKFRHHYETIRDEIERQSKIAAALLPHVLYLAVCFAMWFFFKQPFHDICRGFGAWTIVVGWPIVATSRRLMEYDANSDMPEEDMSFFNADDEDASSQPASSAAPAPAPPPPPTTSVPSTLLQRAQNRVANLLIMARGRVSSEDIRIRDTSAVVSRHPSGIINTSSNTGTDDTVMVSRFESNTDDNNLQDCVESMLYWLKYWSVLAVALLIEQFPITGHVLAVTPFWPELRLVYAIWLQAPITRGADLAFRLVVPLLDHYFKKIIPMTPGGPNASQRSSVLNLMVLGGFISESTRTRLLDLLETGGTLILTAFPFLISPSFITKIGVLIIGLATPSHASAKVVLENQLTDRAGDPLIIRWLQYWVVFTVFSLFYAPLETMFGWWFPLWDQFHMLALLWLQLPYFRGASGLFYFALVVGRVFRKRRRMAARRRSSIAGPQEKLASLMPETMLDRFPSFKAAANLPPSPILVQPEQEEEELRAAPVVGDDAAAPTSPIGEDDGVMIGEEDAGSPPPTSVPKKRRSTTATRYSHVHSVEDNDDLSLPDDDDDDDDVVGTPRAFESILVDEDAQSKASRMI